MCRDDLAVQATRQKAETHVIFCAVFGADITPAALCLETMICMIRKQKEADG